VIAWFLEAAEQLLRRGLLRDYADTRIAPGGRLDTLAKELGLSGRGLGKSVSVTTFRFHRCCRDWNVISVPSASSKPVGIRVFDDGLITNFL
jgi:hypothetical protein